MFNNDILYAKLLDLFGEIQTENDIYKHPGGLSAMFFPLTETVGAKMFSNEYTRDLAYKRQVKAEAVGLAPATGDCFEIPQYIADRFHEEIQWCRYGHYTEMVTCKPDVITWMDTHGGVVECLYDIASALKDLTGFSFVDNHTGNVGIKNDKLVCIDFGEPV